MNSVPISATLEERTSKKGNSYVCVVVRISKNIEKLVFLDQAELELLKITMTQGK